MGAGTRHGTGAIVVGRWHGATSRPSRQGSSAADARIRATICYASASVISENSVTKSSHGIAKVV
jgi:hypothetical protein